MTDATHDSYLLDPSILEGLTEDQKSEALSAAAAARRAEERAEERELERAIAQKVAEREKIAQSQKSRNKSEIETSERNDSVRFCPKRQREKQQVPLRNSTDLKGSNSLKDDSHRACSATNYTKQQKRLKDSNPSMESIANADSKRHRTERLSDLPHGGTTSSQGSSECTGWADKERQTIRQTYLGKAAAVSMAERSLDVNSSSIARVEADHSRRGKDSGRSVGQNGRSGQGKKSTFRFEWDNSDDTLDQSDPLYAGMALVRKHHRSHQSSYESKLERTVNRHTSSVHAKPLDKMTPRDWRIFRENYEIVVKGGRAPPPLRSFREGSLNPILIDAIENVMHYQEPTPIQRQAIPIGLQRRDMIGIAETGSGKTAAFGIPLLQYLLSLPAAGVLSRVTEEGPLAIVLAPTRELALQIHGEFQKLLSRQHLLKVSAVVGGQSIQQQAQELRQGVHVVVGTPGRINDCIDMAYLVLNQCCYVVLDEADRMIDMGFAPQMESILDAMGGLLKSENEAEAYAQEEQDRIEVPTGLPRHRLTAMFSATMPLEVERMAKRYLRHPAVVSIGDQDSVKNARITQRVIYLSSPTQKENALREQILNPRFIGEKVIVFVNEKKHADGVGRIVERCGRQCVVLHGGKSQEQREENLATFRRGGVVLVATDVAGRGLDIPNVAHVINYDLPSRSIDSYNHRIGRTGRAGKEGFATSFLTDQDEGIMAPLKQYLESTGQQVPDKLARHPAANMSNAMGNLIY